LAFTDGERANYRRDLTTHDRHFLRALLIKFLRLSRPYSNDLQARLGAKKIHAPKERPHEANHSFDFSQFNRRRCAVSHRRSL
jgi:hypothetical protein